VDLSIERPKFVGRKFSQMEIREANESQLRWGAGILAWRKLFGGRMGLDPTTNARGKVVELDRLRS